jgi:hypothetical protein
VRCDYSYGAEQAHFHREAFVRDFGEVMRKWRERSAKATLES